MTAVDDTTVTPRPAARRSRRTRPAPTSVRLRTHLTVLEAERDERAKARFDTGGDIGDRAWRMEGETALLQLDAQIRRLRRSLDDAAERVTVRAGDRVAVGATVELRFLADSSLERYVVGALDAQEEDVPVLTPDSPLGRVLLGARVGDTVEYAAPRGSARVVVEAIG